VPKLLIVAATKAEIQPILNHYDIVVNDNEVFSCGSNDTNVSVLLTGVGMVNTAFNLGKYLNDSFTHVINAGICGAFKKDLKTGEVVNVVSDTLSEMGAENDKDFIELKDLNLGTTNNFQNKLVTKYQSLEDIKKVKGITVNTVHGNDNSIQKIISRFDPDVESMEGAAFFSACGCFGGNYFQIRAVSNFVEKRDKSKWNMPLAIKNVNEFVIKLIEDINNK